MQTLYPLKFHPLLRDKIWGGNRLRDMLGKDTRSDHCGESWEISAVQDNLSVVSNGFLAGNNLMDICEVYMGDLMGDHVYEQYGVEFPLLLKFIDATKKLSVQVHPNDELAVKRHHARGKTEMWYVIYAEKGARIITGFNKKIRRKEYLQHLENKTLGDILHFEEAFPDDVFYTPAGRVHAIGAGILLAEIQQTSDVTYRIYDWDRLDERGRSRELHTDLALDAIDYSKVACGKTAWEKNLNRTNPLLDRPYFTTGLVYFSQPIEKDFNFIDSFVAYMCVSGGFTIQCNGSKQTRVEQGETVLVPAVLKNIRLIPHATSETLEIYIR